MPQPKQNYIDAVRGWAILLVMTSHVGGMFPGLPYPIKKLTNFGIYGVQLFFLASAVTLLMSWHRAPRHGAGFISAFFIRRFLRIAPMYYVGALIYFVADPPKDGFDLAQLLRSFAFLNAWRPEWIPTTPGWMVVPGGWSIGVEFTFYALFPVLAALVSSLGRALALFAVTVALACTANGLGAAWLADYPSYASWDFLYYWFPNQAPVFALGFVLYYALAELRLPALPKGFRHLSLAVVGLAIVAVAESPWQGRLFIASGHVPPVLLASLCFMLFVVVLARGPGTLALHASIRKIGVLSFSSYVLHFLMVHGWPKWTGGLIDLHADGYAALANFALLWMLVLLGTLAAAAVAHAVIEQPGIDLAHRLTSRPAPALPQSA